MAIKAVGEVEVTLGGKAYTLRPSWGAFEAIDNRLNCGIVEALTAIIASKRMSVAAVCLWAFATNGGKNDPRGKTDVEFFGEKLVEEGLIALTPALESLLWSGLKKRRDEEESPSSEGEKSHEVRLEPSDADWDGNARVDA